MDPLLSDSLNVTDRTYLGSLTFHEGYKVLIRMANEACARKNAEVIKLNPEDPQYSRKLAALQMTARAASEFSALLFKSVEWHAQLGAVQTKELEDVEKTEAKKLVV
jgi:hypothetical protein